MCEGLLHLGVCKLIAKEDVHHVEGRPLLNGLFGVSKREFHEGWEVRRLIMNLIPCNRICRSMDGDVATLPSWAGMNALQLQPHEDLVISSEDVKCFFYIFRVPENWHRFLAFDKLVLAHLCPTPHGQYYLCSAVLPMGFKNSVSLAQRVRRVIVQRALRSSQVPLGGESEVRKDRPFPSSANVFRVYLGNLDELKRVNRQMADMINGKVSFGYRTSGGVHATQCSTSSKEERAAKQDSRSARGHRGW